MQSAHTAVYGRTRTSHADVLDVIQELLELSRGGVLVWGRAGLRGTLEAVCQFVALGYRPTAHTA